MGVRTIGFKFTGDYRELTAALAAVEAQVRATVASVDRSNGASSGAATRAATATRGIGDAATRSGAQVVAAEQRATAAVNAHAAAATAAADASVRAAALEAQAAASATAARDLAAAAGTGAAAGAAQIAASDAAAAAAARAEATVAAAAESSAAAQVASAQRTAAQEIAIRDAAVRRMAAIEAAAYRENAARNAAQVANVRRLAAAELAAYAENDRRIAAAAAARASAVAKFGKSLLLIGAVAAVGIGVAVKAFAEFDQAMSRVSAGTDATGASLGRLRAKAIDAGAKTQYSATEAADGITALGKAGVSVTDILAGGLDGALDLAAAGQLSVADAAEISATAMTQFGLKGQDLTHVADLLAAGAGKAQGNVTDLSYALKYVGPVAAGLGVSIEETTGALAEFASQGIIGEQAGTSLRGVLLSLTSPSKKAADELDALGISLYDQHGKFIGLAGVAGQLRGALKGLDAQSRDAALGIIFGNHQVTAARVLYSGGAGEVENWTRKVNDSGFAARQAARLTDNLRGDIERLGGSLQTVFIQTGSTPNGFLRGLTQGLEGAVNIFSKAPAKVQDTVFELLALISVVALTGGAFLVAIPKIAAYRAALTSLGVTSEVVSAKVAFLSKAAGAIAVYIVAMQGLGAVLDKTGDKAISADKLNVALDNLAHNKTATGLKSLGDNFEYVGTKLDQLTNPSKQDRFGDFVGTAINFASFGATNSSGGSEGRRAFLADLGSLDTQLTQLVNSGHGDEAANLFTKINDKAIAGGAGVDQLAGHLPKFIDATDQAAVAAGASANQIGNMGVAATVAATKAAALTKQVNDYVDATKKKVGDVFNTDTDVLGNFDPTAKAKAQDATKEATDRLAKAQQHLSDVEAAANDRKKGATKTDAREIRDARQEVKDAQVDVSKANAAGAKTGLAATYSATIREAADFATNIQKALARGLDPQYVEELLEEGPKKAGPILDTILQGHSNNLIGIVNKSEKKLRELNAVVVEEARLTALAIASKSDKLTTDLSKALAIANEKAAQGAGATAESIARKLKLPPGTVSKIAGEFGITVITSAQKEINKHRLEARAKATITIETHGGKQADNVITGIHDGLETLPRTKTITVKINTKGPAGLLDPNYGKKGHGLGVVVDGKADGGLISRSLGGPRQDNVPLLVSAGEYVIRASSVSHYGDEFMHAINHQRLPKFADGGPVASISSVVNARTAAIPAAVMRIVPAAPTIVRVPVHETHTRTIQTGDLHLSATNPNEFEDWSLRQQRNAERSFS